MPSHRAASSRQGWLSPCQGTMCSLGHLCCFPFPSHSCKGDKQRHLSNAADPHTWLFPSFPMPSFHVEQHRERRGTGQMARRMWDTALECLAQKLGRYLLAGFGQSWKSKTAGEGKDCPWRYPRASGFGMDRTWILRCQLRSLSCWIPSAGRSFQYSPLSPQDL